MFQKDVKDTGTTETLLKDQALLLHIHERHNHVTFIADVQLMDASSDVLKEACKHEGRMHNFLLWF